jgi:DNA-binding transcriptional regulator YhcF (GntR family)
MNQITRLRKDRAAEPVLAESLKDQAYEAIKHRIITCAFKPGQELSENTVAGLLRIGRTPVHQAFDRLNTEGLVDVQPRKGVVVRPINLDEVIEIIEIRLLNEAFAVRLAAERLYPMIRTALLSTSIALVPSALLSSNTCFRYLHLDRADFLKIKTISCVFRRKYGFHDAPGHDDLPRFQLEAPRSQLRGKPRDRIEGMPEDVAAVPFADRNIVFRRTSEDAL